MVNFSLHTIEPGIKINGNWIRLIDLIIEVVIIDNRHNEHKLMLHMQIVDAISGYQWNLLNWDHKYKIDILIQNYYSSISFVHHCIGKWFLFETIWIYCIKHDDKCPSRVLLLSNTIMVTLYYAETTFI